MAQDINALEGWEFENLIYNLVKKMGFATEERERGSDGGIDILAFKDEPLLKGKYVIQCKRYSTPVGVEIIRDLYGVVHSTNANKGILITNSTFTNAAIEFSQDKQIELIDGNRLLNLLREYEIEGFLKKSVEIPISVLFTYDHLIRPMKDTINSIKNYRDGVVYINKETYSESRYNLLINNHYNKLWEYYDSLIAQYDRSVQLLSSNTDKELEQIKHYSKIMVNAVKLVVKNYIEIIKVNPPPKLIEAHKLFLNVFENIFAPWESYINQFEDLIKNPPKDDKVIDLIADFRGIHESLMTFKSQYEATAYGSSGSEYDALDTAVDVVDTASSFLSGCFIVTAVYDSPLAEEINPFRAFRDKVLKPNLIGDAFVLLYYSMSPPLASIIRRSKSMKKWLRILLIEPILRYLKYKGFQ